MANCIPLVLGQLNRIKSQALENQRLTFTMFAMFLFICQSFRHSGFQSSSSKLLIYTSQKERISFSSPAKKLS